MYEVYVSSNLGMNRNVCIGSTDTEIQSFQCIGNSKRTTYTFYETFITIHE